jgi:hypothetical protein
MRVHRLTSACWSPKCMNRTCLHPVERPVERVQKASAPFLLRDLQLIGLVAAVTLTRIAFRSHALYDIDSVNFALGMQRFDTAVHQPHSPGYFLYICLARLVNTFFHNENAALVAISIASSCGCAAMLYALARRWFGARAGAFAGLIFLVSPLAWFHGVVALTYMVEAFLSALAGWLCWRIYSGERGVVVPAALVLGIGAGIRPSFLLFLSPLFFYSLWRLGRNDIWKGTAVLAGAFLCWFVPMVYDDGGVFRYMSALDWLWTHVAARHTVLNSALSTSIVRVCGIMMIYAFCFGSSVVAVPRAFYLKSQASPDMKRFTYVWIAPALLFFTLVFLRLVNSGYLLVIFPPACIWLAFWASDWYAEGRWPTAWKISATMALSVLNILMFLEAPAYWSYRSIRQFETELAGIRAAIQHISSPETTLLVGFDSHFLGYRHAGYYLPNYTTVQFPAVPLPGGRRIFAMHQRDTRLLARLDTSAYKRFILFPLPAGDPEYEEYLRQIEARLPASGLVTVLSGGRTFVSAPIADLRFLFPGEVPPSIAPVYTAHHSLTASVNIR